MKVWLFKARNGGLDASEGVKATFREHLKRHEGKTYRVEFVETARSLSQNAYYWAYLEMVAGETGHTADELHEIFRQKFLPTKIMRGKGGREYVVAKSTTKLRKAEFSDYLDKIAAETNVPLPDPEAAGYISNYGSG